MHHSLKIVTATAAGRFQPAQPFAGGFAGFLFDLSRTDLLFQNSNGTTAVALNDDPVGYAQSLDPAARTATQATAANRPLWKTGGSIFHDGTNDDLASTHNPSLGMTLMAKITPSSAGRVIMGSAGVLNTTNTYIGINASGFFGGGVGTQGFTVILDGVDRRTTTGVGAMVFDGSTVRLYWNGVQTYSAAQSGVANTTRPFFIGSLNNAGTPASYYGGNIFKAFAINRAMNSAEVAAMSAFMA